jgi:hypothetical protein
MAATMLPILDGGFDQKQLVVGVVRRFDRKPSRRRDPMMMGAADRTRTASRAAAR